MNDDDDIRSMLGRVFVDEPPVHFTRSDVIVKGQRIRRRRRLVAAGSAVASMAAVAAAVLIVASFHGSADPDIGPARAPQLTCTQTTTMYTDLQGQVFVEPDVPSCECPPIRVTAEPGAVIGSNGVLVRGCVLVPYPNR